MIIFEEVGVRTGIEFDNKYTIVDPAHFTFQLDYNRNKIQMIALENYQVKGARLGDFLGEFDKDKVDWANCDPIQPPPADNKAAVKLISEKWFDKLSTSAVTA